MSISTCFCKIKNFPKTIWTPCDKKKYLASTSFINKEGVKMASCMGFKFLGRTITLLGAGAITAFCLNILACTKLGFYIGITALAATVTAWPTALLVTSAAATVIATSLLTSILIEVYV